MDIKKYGFKPDMMPEDKEGMPARVTAVHKERYELASEQGTIYARLKTKEYYWDNKQFPTTGDFVLINYIEDGDSQIIDTMPRRTYFSRRNPTPGMGEQIVAANFDYVFIMQSLNNDFNPNRLERYLALAWQSGAIPVVVLTKADLLDDYYDYLFQVERVAEGATVHVVSAKTGYGLDELEGYLQPEKTVTFLGSSGVGKSSLVNALSGKEIMAENEIREDDSKGRHTTTHRQLIMLDNGAMIIDTPGMREIGMWTAAEGMNEAFSDVSAYFGQCKFRNCSHTSEPGCAIKAAIESGELSQKRWDNYCKLKLEEQYANDKEQYIRNKQRWHKEIAIANKKNRNKF